MKPALSPKEERFCLEWWKNGGDSTAAYRVAFPHCIKWQDSSVHVRASMLIATEKVQLRIKELRDAAAEVAMVGPVETLKELAALVFCDPATAFDEAGDVLPIRNMPRSTRAAIAAVKQRRTLRGELVTEVKFWDKNAALDKLMRHLGLFERDNEQKKDAYEDLLQAMSELLGGKLPPPVVREPEAPPLMEVPHTVQ